MKIAVVDYKAGNLKSVENALQYLKTEYYISDDPEKLINGDKLIFPGVGHARSAMDKLNDMGITEMLREYAKTGKDMFGICIGSQIMLDHSEEGDTELLGIIKGQTLRFKEDGRKIPHMGWNTAVPAVNHFLFDGIPADASFYFVHSYYTLPENEENVLCRTDYEEIFSSGLYKDNVCAVQFHPEKSGRWGLKLIENFINK